MSLRSLTLIVLVPSIILHEVAHGVVALAFGDDTARRAGRLTLNPLAHIDPFGTVLLPLLLWASGAGMFGFAKPVPVNPRRLRNPRQQSVLVSLAGPATNVVLAVGAAAVLAVAFRVRDSTGALVVPSSLPARLLFAVGLSNVVLAAFNLIPVPPLDGSAVIERVLPRSWWPGWLRFRQYSMGVLLVVVLVLPRLFHRAGVLDPVFNGAFRLWAKLL